MKFSNFIQYSESIPYPVCVVHSKGSKTIIKAVSSEYCQIAGFDPKNAVGKDIFDPQFGHIFRGCEEILGSCLMEVKKDKKRTSLILDEFNTFSKTLSSPVTWMLEINSLDFEDSSDYLLLSFHDITNVLNIDNRNETQTNNEPGHISFHDQAINLQEKVNRKELQFKAATGELDNFVYSVSHDLRAPLRRIDGFSQELINEYSDRLDKNGVHYLNRIIQAAQHMGELIDDLLKLSRISRKVIERESVDLSILAKNIYEELIESEPGRRVIFEVSEEGLITEADDGLANVVLTNLISNALKFSSKNKETRINVGKKVINGRTFFYISDNGVGFDPEHSKNLFKAFTRLHSQRDFIGSGIGLATVKRIINLHGGEIYGEGILDKGATFFFNFN